MSRLGEPHRRPSVLVINPDLPRYGVKSHEFCNTVGLSEDFTVGLVTQLAKPADWADVRRLQSRGISMYVAEPTDACLRRLRWPRRPQRGICVPRVKTHPATARALA